MNTNTNSVKGQLKAIEGAYIYNNLIKDVNTLDQKTIPVKVDLLNPKNRNN